MEEIWMIRLIKIWRYLKEKYAANILVSVLFIVMGTVGILGCIFGLAVLFGVWEFMKEFFGAFAGSALMALVVLITNCFLFQQNKAPLRLEMIHKQIEYCREDILRGKKEVDRLTSRVHNPDKKSGESYQEIMLELNKNRYLVSDREDYLEELVAMELKMVRGYLKLNRPIKHR